MKPEQPIGVFDSGIGGLTVVKAVKEILPNESIIYFGDTVHLPYGDKTAKSIQEYSLRISDYLMERKCKVILIACNSASAAAYPLVKEHVGKEMLVVDVITPVAKYISSYLKNEKLGLIGTKQTISTKAYERQIEKHETNITINSLATPLLAPMIEEGINDPMVCSAIIKYYLSNPLLRHIDSLILGCTHYPIIKRQIEEYYLSEKENIKIIDSGSIVANTLKSLLTESNLCAFKKNKKDEFKVSELTPSFKHTSKLFFGKKITLEQLPL